MAKNPAPDAAGQVTVDLDGVLVLAHSDEQDATATWKKTFGNHPLMGSSITEAAAAVIRWPGCSGRATRAATPRITSPRPHSPWLNCRRDTVADAGR